MTLNEVKKALYREKPMAECSVAGLSGKENENTSEMVYSYKTKLVNGLQLTFIIPESDYDESIFGSAMEAHLLIRWLKYKEPIVKTTLKGIDKNTVVHTKTQEEAEKVVKIAGLNGYLWINGKSYSEFGNKWEVRKEKTCYSLEEGTAHGIDYFTGEGYKILTAEEFFALNDV